MGNTFSKPLKENNKTLRFIMTDEYGDFIGECDGKTIKITRTKTQIVTEKQRKIKWWNMINGGRKVIEGIAIIKLTLEWHFFHNDDIPLHVSSMVFELNGEWKTISMINIPSETVRITSFSLEKWKNKLQGVLSQQDEEWKEINKMCWIPTCDQSQGCHNNISNYCWYDKCKNNKPLLTKKELELRRKWKKRNRRKKRKKLMNNTTKFKVVCQGCKTASYCCRKHQKMDWKTGHKIYCVSGRLIRFVDFYCVNYIGFHCFD